jgi:hypothetical protein
MQEGEEFEDRVSSMLKKNLCNNHLITNTPKSPPHGSKHQPEETSLLAGVIRSVL